MDRKHLAVDLGNRPRPAYGLVPWQPLAAPAQPGQGRVAPAGLGLEAVVMVWLLRDCYPRWAETGHNLAGEIYTVLGHSLKPGREATPGTSGKHARHMWVTGELPMGGVRPAYLASLPAGSREAQAARLLAPA